MSKVVDLSINYSLISEYVAELRDKAIQLDRLRFCANLERLGFIFGYEISKDLACIEREVITCLGKKNCKVIAQQPILATVLRAGLPMHTGMFQAFDRAESAFISAFREYKSDGSFDIKVEYLACPNLDGRTLILCDPMLATGKSAISCIKALMKHGTPQKIILASIIASEQGITLLQQHLADVEIWIGALDHELNTHSYIVPGLGDAGDLAYGLKL